MHNKRVLVGVTFIIILEFKEGKIWRSTLRYDINLKTTPLFKFLEKYTLIYINLLNCPILIFLNYLSSELLYPQSNSFNKQMF